MENETERFLRLLYRFIKDSEVYESRTVERSNTAETTEKFLESRYNVAESLELLIKSISGKL